LFWRRNTCLHGRDQFNDGLTHIVGWEPHASPFSRSRGRGELALEGIMYSDDFEVNYGVVIKRLFT
jgi:hypothetical protein